MTWKNQKVKLTKIGASQNPEFPTPAKEEYQVGVYNLNVSVPVDYWITGKTYNEPQVDSRLIIVRETRNGVEAFGELTTSIIKSIKKGSGQDSRKLVLETCNSVYLLEKIDG